MVTACEYKYVACGILGSIGIHFENGAKFEFDPICVPNLSPSNGSSHESSLKFMHGLFGLQGKVDIVVEIEKKKNDRTFVFKEFVERKEKADFIHCQDVYWARVPFCISQN